MKIKVKDLTRKQRFGIIMIGVGVTFMTTLSTGVGAGLLGFGFILFIRDLV